MARLPQPRSVTQQTDGGYVNVGKPTGSGAAIASENPNNGVDPQNADRRNTGETLVGAGVPGVPNSALPSTHKVRTPPVETDAQKQAAQADTQTVGWGGQPKANP